MKFQFEGYPYPEGEDYIEIDFDFMEKSEFIRALEPDLMDPVMIPERFEKYQIDEFKLILEKITRKEEIKEEDKYLCNSKVLKPLFEYFRVDINEIKIKYYFIQKVHVKSFRYLEKGLNKGNLNEVVENFEELYKSKEDAKKEMKIKLYEMCKAKKFKSDSYSYPIHIKKDEKFLILPISNFNNYKIMDDEIQFDIIYDPYVSLKMGELFSLKIVEIDIEKLRDVKYHKYHNYKINLISASRLDLEGGELERDDV